MGIAGLFLEASKAILGQRTLDAVRPWFTVPEIMTMITTVRTELVADPDLLAAAKQAGVELGTMVYEKPNAELLVECATEMVEYQRVKSEITAFRERLREQLTAVAAPVVPQAESTPPEQSEPDESGVKPKRKPPRRTAPEADYLQSVQKTIEEFLNQNPNWSELAVQQKAADEQLRAAVRRKLLESIRLALNVKKQERERDALYRQELEPGDAPGLLDEEADPVATATVDELGRLLRGSRGSIGLAGPRGSGKSTILRGMYKVWPQAAIKILVPAPASYVPREFLVHLYTEICQYIFDYDSDGKRREKGGRPVPNRVAGGAATALIFFMLPAVATLTGVYLMAVYAAGARTPAQVAAFGGALLTVGVVPLALRLIEKRKLPTSAGSLEERLLARSVIGWSQPRLSGLLLAIAAAGVLLVLSTMWFVPDLLTTRRAAGAALLIAGLATALLRHRPPPSYSFTGSSSGVAVVLESGARGAVPLMAVAAAQIVAVAAGTALLLIPPSVSDPDARLVAGVALTAAGAVALRVGLAVRAYLDRTKAPPVENDDLVRDARRGLRRLGYVRSETSGWSGTVKLGGGNWLPVGVDAGTSGSVSDTELPLGVPQIVKETVALLKARGPAFVAIDELDKIESAEKARDLLSELKPLFTAPNTFFFVSVSEDAIASFERRGLPFRDIFDSAFDEVVPIPYLSFADSLDLIRSRTLFVPPPFIALAYCASGGLARDLIRTTRHILHNGGDLERVAGVLVHRDLRGKTAAVTSAIRGVLLEPESSAVLRALGRIDACPLDGPRTSPCLLDDDWLCSIEKLGAQLQASAGDAPTDLSDRRLLRRLAMELVGYHYYCRTLLELFVVTEDADLRRLERVIDDENGVTLSHLARARQSFMLNPYVAWDAVTECRDNLGLHADDTPASLLASAVTAQAEAEIAPAITAPEVSAIEEGPSHPELPAASSG
ncbi:hypothetical protein ACQPZX_20165 [Actinoplanes sp. CA-142083]|uniref:hypothetical protein n=1 Tax=Actinoplanes sp. CA-142083 TaxID=3239903 RepID=UPI003D8A99DE